MEPIRNYAIALYNNVVNSQQYANFSSFCKRYITKTDLVMGGLLIGGLFFKRDAFGYDCLIPKICGTYFAGKLALCLFQKTNPSLYGEIAHNQSSFMSKLWNKIVPDDFLNCYKIVTKLFEPYLCHFKNLTTFGILGGVYKASVEQKPIALSSKELKQCHKDILNEAAIYSKLATGIYGAMMVYGVMREIDSASDVKHLLSGNSSKEGYIQAFCDHCHLTNDDILYVDWGCESDEKVDEDSNAKSDVIVTSNGSTISHPPLFLVRHEETKSIVLCIRGTWNIQDFIVDFKCYASEWGLGKAHEGIALISNALLADESLNTAITTALKENPEYRLVAVGHSLGAGIASLLTINWRYKKMYGKPVCFAIAPPPILTASVWDKGQGYVHSFVNEDDIVPRLSKNGLEDAIMNITSNCHEKLSWMDRLKRKTEETCHSLFKVTETFVNMYLPGTVYYLHPCMDNYELYEKRKRRITGEEEASMMERMRNMITKVDGNPGCCVYSQGSDFPNTIILSPMLLVHHFANSYERMLECVTEFYSRSL